MANSTKIKPVLSHVEEIATGATVNHTNQSIQEREASMIQDVRSMVARATKASDHSAEKIELIAMMKNRAFANAQPLQQRMRRVYEEAAPHMIENASGTKEISDE